MELLSYNFYSQQSQELLRHKSGCMFSCSGSALEANSAAEQEQDILWTAG